MIQPFKDFLLSYLTDSTQQRLFAFTFADQIHRDRNALVIDLEDVYIWLGHSHRHHAVRHLKNEFAEGQYAYIAGVTTNGDPKDQRDRYLISITMFKKLLLSSRSQQGKDYRDLIITIEGAAYDYLKIEMERARELIEEHKVRTADLAKQVEDLRLSRITFWLYAYRLFENRYKCGFTTDIEARTKQHKTSCPSGYLSHKVVVHSKALEKVMDSVLKAHGRHITQEEYIFDGGDSQVQLVLDTIARVEDSLHSVSFERYEDLLSAVNGVLNAETQTNEHSSSERQAFSDESIANVAADPQVTLSAALTTMTPRERVVAFIDQHLRLDRDRKDRRYFIRIRALHEYYTKVSRDGVEPLHLGEFSAHIRELLAANWKGGISFRDHYYRGIECV